MTDIIESLSKRVCPDCGNDGFRNGPRGGLSRNIECLRCGNRFNVTWWHDRLVWADRLPHRDQGPQWIFDYDQLDRIEELACAIGEAVADSGQRPETWLTDEARGRIVAVEAMRVMIERKIKL